MTPEKLPISLVLIAKNEGDTLPRCLKSAPFVSEIIAVINNCTDNTREVLESFGAKIHEHPWQGMAEQKNLALSHATQPWILNLDADEEISPELLKSIYQFFEKKSNSESDFEKFNGAYSSRKTWLMGRWIKHGDWYPDYITRIFKKGHGKFKGDNDHENVVIEGKPKKLKGDLLHYSFPNINVMLSKMAFFANAFVKNKTKKGKKFSAIETTTRSIWRFFRCYFVKLGFLDGFPGFFIAVHQGFYTFFRYSSLFEHEKKSEKPTP